MSICQCRVLIVVEIAFALSPARSENINDDDDQLAYNISLLAAAHTAYEWVTTKKLLSPMSYRQAPSRQQSRRHTQALWPKPSNTLVFISMLCCQRRRLSVFVQGGAKIRIAIVFRLTFFKMIFPNLILCL